MGRIPKSVKTAVMNGIEGLKTVDVNNEKQDYMRNNNNFEVMFENYPVIHQSTVNNNHEAALKIFLKQLNAAYASCNSKYINHIQNARSISCLNLKQLKGHDATLKEVWHGIIGSMQTNIKRMTEYIRDIPGIDSIDDIQDLRIIINHHIMDYYLVCL